MSSGNAPDSGETTPSLEIRPGGLPAESSPSVMASETRTLEDEINPFLRKYSPFSKGACLSLAKRLLGPDLEESPLQDPYSFSFLGMGHVAHFRTKEYPLSLKRVALAKTIHGRFVPQPTNLHWTISLSSDLAEDGHESDTGVDNYNDDSNGPNPNLASTAREKRLIIYCLHQLPGKRYSEISLPTELNTDQFRLQRKRIYDLSQFFSQSWSSPQSLQPEKLANIHSYYTKRLQKLCRQLPRIFRTVLQNCKSRLPKMLESLDKLPFVLTNRNITPDTLLIDPESGDITGMTDWSFTSTMPFGFGIYALQNLLGYIDKEKGTWIYHDQYESLENTFWCNLNINCALLGEENLENRRLIRDWFLLSIFMHWGFTNDSKRGKYDELVVHKTRILKGMVLGREEWWFEFGKEPPPPLQIIRDFGELVGPDYVPPAAMRRRVGPGRDY